MSNVSQLKGTDNTTYDIVSKIGRGLVRATMDSTSTSTAFKVTADGITELYEGLAIIVKNTVIASASGCTLQVNNLTAKGMVRSIGGTAVTTHWALNAEYIFIYNGTSWVMQMGYDSNSDTKVRQTLKSDNVDRPLLMAYSDNSTTTGNVDNVSYRNNSIYANASTGTITATKFNGPSTSAETSTMTEGNKFASTKYGGSALDKLGTLKELRITPSSFGMTDANGCIDLKNFGLTDYCHVLSVITSNWGMGPSYDVAFTPVFYKGSMDFSAKLMLKFTNKSGVPYANQNVSDFVSSSNSATIDILYLETTYL